MEVLSGSAYPFGVSKTQEGLNFAIYAEDCEEMSLCLFHEEDLEKPFFEVSLVDLRFRTGNVWHALIKDLPQAFCYGFKVKREGNTYLLLDPYAKSIASPPSWTDEVAEKKPFKPLGKFFQDSSFEWENDRPLNLAREDLIIYEMHVRGFTKQGEEVTHKGTYAGMIEKIPYLKELGVNAVELLPIHEFDETDVMNKHPETEQNLHNYFGYSTVNFFSPMNRYASDSKGDNALKEFKNLVKELHKNGIEVLLDVVFNHTFEGNGQGPTTSFKGLNPKTFYMINDQGDYLNFSGCGNTFNCNHPITRELIIDALRYWVMEMHVDGFRFDLASVFNRAADGTPLPNPPLMEAITNDPILKNTKLIAEPWDCAMYQVGFFSNYHSKWSEWNGAYRDIVRKFIKGAGSKREFADAICGSRFIYDGAKSPWCSVNFITVHDGFTLRDLVSYNEKHNEANGEENRDGSDSNESWNCGFEGETDDEEIRQLRVRQMRNFMTALFISQGIPMIQMGDEYGHTKHGNNNSWCQDNEMNWFHWDQIKTKEHFFNFVKELVRFRKETPIFHKKDFFDDKDVRWHGLALNEPDWENENSLIALTMHDKGEEEPTLYIAFNASHLEQTFTVPELDGKNWFKYLDSSQPSPTAIGVHEKLGENQILAAPYSCVILVKG